MYLYKYHETLALLSLSTKMVYCLLRLSLHKRQQQQHHKPANKAGKTSTASKPCWELGMLHVAAKSKNMPSTYPWYTEEKCWRILKEDGSIHRIWPLGYKNIQGCTVNSINSISLSNFILWYNIPIATNNRWSSVRNYEHFANFISMLG